MTKKKRYYICLYVIFQCFTLNASVPVFTEKKIQIKVPDIAILNNAARWYLNFDKLKKTVVYSNHLISMGFHGGLVCINPTKMEFDSVYTKKINTDFYTNMICRQDTLFAEKFGKIFYLNPDTLWMEYHLKIPIKLFEIVYEDEHYIFYPSDFGEWGSSLFIYDKYLNCTKGLKFYYKRSLRRHRQTGLKISFWLLMILTQVERCLDMERIFSKMK